MRRARVHGGLYEGKRGKVLRVEGPDESFIRSAISKYLDALFVIHAITDARLVPVGSSFRRCVWPDGWPDITAMLPITGQLWAIECKSETGELRESQIDLLPLVEASGGIVTIARDVLPVRQLINDHYARFTVAEINAHKGRVRGLREQAARRQIEREIAANLAGNTQTKGRGRRLNKAVDSDEAGRLFEV